MKQIPITCVCIVAAVMAIIIAIPNCATAAEQVLLQQENVVKNFPEQTTGFSSADVANGERETLAIPVISWRDMPFQTVKRQALDFSCGSAAISTLLTYVYGNETSEGSVFKTMFERGDKEKIRREGFSLLDMSNYLNSRGFKAVGYKMDLDAIQKNKIPFIALVNNKGYNHFIVVKSVRGNHVLVGDPNKGNVIYTRQKFAQMWNGIALAITNHAQKAYAVFGDDKEWKYAHSLASTREQEYAGLDGTVLPPLQWQIAPSGFDVLDVVLNNVSIVAP